MHTKLLTPRAGRRRKVAFVQPQAPSPRVRADLDTGRRGFVGYPPGELAGPVGTLLQHLCSGFPRPVR